MCGRYSLRAKLEAIEAYFGASLRGEPPRPRYNIAPTQRVLILRADESGTPALSYARWGLVPSWAKDTKIGNSLINARAETVATKPSFRSAFKRRRCLIPADGFYEWGKSCSKKQPYLIHRPDDSLFAFAGLWEQWGAEQLVSCTIITTEANDATRGIHDRSPVILQPDEWPLWLDPDVEDKELLQGMLKPSTLPLERVAVSSLVNSVRNESPECVEAIEG